ncbi:hypothetical protein BV20DRAFT_1112140 [Pilatotrama ljubarskyi]|nr:hypothetical protein BV20DRAFT_1112140 [Pilatotrama ljubarskyi]
MHLYNLTVQPPTAITDAIVGNFSGTRQQEIVVSRGTRLELLRLDAQTGKLSIVVASDVFGSRRSLNAFRLTGGSKNKYISGSVVVRRHYVVVGSDSGGIVILEYAPQTSSFVKVHQETYGKSGARRIVPGQFLATDPKGRALMIAAIEKAKLVYILNRDAAAKLTSTVSSPLEAHKANAIIHHIVGLDVGFGNPTFAALEVDYTESAQDATVRPSIMRRRCLPTTSWISASTMSCASGASPLTPMPTCASKFQEDKRHPDDRCDGPSGVLVCCEDHVIYRHMGAPQHRVPIPRGNYPFQDEERGLLITAAVMHKMKGTFFFLLQSEEGEVYKVTIEHDEQEVKALKIKYFDTVPVASSLCILKSGFLFVAAELGNHCDPVTCQFDAYIVLSFINGILVLSIGETITDAEDSGFLTTSPTIAVQQIGVDGLLQVHPCGIRHILADKRVNEWRAPDDKTIVNATTNKRQVVVALSSGELAYVQLDLEGQLHEFQDRRAMGSTILSLSIAEVPEGRQRTPYLAVGCEDQTVRIVSLAPENTLEVISLQALTAPPSSICIAEILDTSLNRVQPTTFVNIGLRNGVLLRTVLDSASGQLTDTPAQAQSSRTWLNYTHQKIMHFTPLIYENLDFAWTFSAELLPNGFIEISWGILRLFHVSKLGVAAGDRFGNVVVNRLDPKVSDQVDDDPVRTGILQEKRVPMGAPHKTSLTAHFHIGDIVTSLNKVSMVTGALDVIVYTGLHGTVGALVPLLSKEDVDFISTLEQHLRAEQLSLVGRDHLAWRGYYIPVKAVTDGDLCEMFGRLPPHRQSAIAFELDRTVGEVLKKLAQLRVIAVG